MPIRAALIRHGLTLLGCCTGLLLGALILTIIRQEIRPHAWLEAHAPARFYVETSCPFSQLLLDDLATDPGPRKAVVIPLDERTNPAREALCAAALAQLREQGGVLWRWLPDSYLCARLVDDARTWAAQQAGEMRVPSWSIDGGPVISDYTAEHIASLRAHGLLGAAAP